MHAGDLAAPYKNNEAFSTHTQHFALIEAMREIPGQAVSGSAHDVGSQPLLHSDLTGHALTNAPAASIAAGTLPDVDDPTGNWG